MKGKHLHLCCPTSRGDNDGLIFIGVPGPGSRDNQVQCCSVYFTLYIALHCVV